MLLLSEWHTIIWTLPSSLLKHDLPAGRAGCRSSGCVGFSMHPRKEFLCFSETGRQDLITQLWSSLKWGWGGTTASISTEGNERNFPRSPPVCKQRFTPWVTSHCHSPWLPQHCKHYQHLNCWNNLPLRSEKVTEMCSEVNRLKSNQGQKNSVLFQNSLSSLQAAMFGISAENLLALLLEHLGVTKRWKWILFT